MKIGKKLLSLLLAVLMVITSFSVGFTALAGENKTDTNNNYWTEGTDAKAAYASLNNLVDTYLPALFQNESIKKLLEENLGMTVTSKTTIKDVVAGASPTVNNLLKSLTGGGSSHTRNEAISDITGKTAESDWDKYYSYLDGTSEDSMSFADLYFFCKDVMANESKYSDELVKYAKDTDQKLRKLVNAFASQKAEYDSLVKEQKDKIVVIEDAFAADSTNSGHKFNSAKTTKQKISVENASLYELQNWSYNGTLVKDLPVADYNFIFSYYNGILSAIGSTIKINTVADYMYYVDGLGKDVIKFETWLYFINRSGAKVTAQALGGDSTALTLSNYKSIIKNLYSYDTFMADTEFFGKYEKEWSLATNSVVLADYVQNSKIYKKGAKAVAKADTATSWVETPEAYNSFYEDYGVATQLQNLMSIKEYGGSTYYIDVITDPTEISTNYYADIMKGYLDYCGYDNSKISSFYITDDQLDKLYTALTTSTDSDGNKYYSETGGVKTWSSTTTYYDWFAAYLSSSNSPFSSYMNEYFLSYMTGSDLNNKLSLIYDFIDRVLNKDYTGVKALVPADYTELAYNRIGRMGLIEGANYSVSSYIAKDIYGANERSGKYDVVISTAFTKKYEFDKYIKALIPSSYNYKYSDYAIPNSCAVEVTNNTVNTLISTYLSDSTELGKMISGAVDALLESDVELYKGDGSGVLEDLWLDLYNDPISAIFNLLPTLIILIDEVVLPMALNGSGDDYYNSGRGVLYDLLTGLIPALKDVTQEAGNTEVGLGCLRFDLNILVPSILHYLEGDVEFAASACGYYTGANDPTNIYDDNVIRFTNIYVVDKALTGAHLDGGLVSPLEKAGLDTNLAKGIDDVVTELAAYALPIIDNYVNGEGADEIRYNTDGGQVQVGLNNILVALPQIIDGLGSTFMKKYNVDSDWRYIIADPLASNSKIQQSAESNNYYNTSVKAFKDLAVQKDSEKVLATFIDILTQDWLNAIFDFANDIIQSDDDVISKEIPIVSALLQALGGFGEKSLITDLFDGLFQLKRSDEASFTFTKQDKTGFVGLKDASGFFLISNLLYTKNGVQKGLIPFITGIIDGKSSAKYDVHNAFAKVNSSSALRENATETTKLLSATKSSAGTVYSELLTSKNVKAANELVETIDSLLSTLLANTSINDYTLTATDNLLEGVVTFASAYLGAENTNDIVKLLNNYLYYIAGESRNVKTKDGKIGVRPDSNGDVVDSKVYTSKNLSTLVIQTYSLVENIVDYLFYNKDSGFLASRDSNMLIGDALYGILSPDSVAVRIEDDYNATAKVLKDSKYQNWNDFKIEMTTANVNNKTWQKDYLKYGFSDGDKDGFYSALASSFSGILGILSVVLVDGNYYEGVVYPVLDSLAKAQGVGSKVMSPSAFKKASIADQTVKGILTPVSAILDGIYEAPATWLLNLVKGLAGVLDDTNFKKLMKNVTGPINSELKGLYLVVDYLSGAATPNSSYNLTTGIVNAKNKLWTVSPAYPKAIVQSSTSGYTPQGALAKYLSKLIGDKLNIKVPSKNSFIGLINNALAGKFTLPNANWSKLNKASTPGEVLLLVYGYLVDGLLGNKTIKALLKVALGADLTNTLTKLTAAQLLDIINQVLKVTQSPTEIYWTFKNYAAKITGDFVYPKNVSASEADEAVDQLDELVANVFPLLQTLGVADYEDLNDVLSGLLYKNSTLTSMVTAIYGALDGNDTIKTVLGVLNLDVSPKGFAKYLTDSSYGKTYSSAAKTLSKATSWKQVKSLNWGFTDGSAKAETGFINGLAAALRPLNDLLSVFLAEGTFVLGNEKTLTKAIKSLSFSGKTNIGSGEYGCKMWYSIKNGVVTLKFQNNVGTHYPKNVVKIELIPIIKEITDIADGELALNCGTNGYENAVVPLLEVLMCDGVKTYKEYKADYKKAKDNLLIDVLKPLFNFVDDVAEKPFNTLTKVLPNLAYFIDSSGVEQIVANLLAPITSSKGIIGILKKNGIDIDAIIKAIAGKDLGGIIANALGIKTKVTLKLSDLASSNIHEILVPAINAILKKNKINIVVPNIDWSKLAACGTLKTLSSKAKNSKGSYTRKAVIANKGQVLATVLRYIGTVLTKNAKSLKTLLCGIDAIKKNATVKNIIASVFDNIATYESEDIVDAVYYILCGEADNNYFDYSQFITKEYDFSFGTMDEDFCRKLAPMLDGLVAGLVDLNSLVTEKVYTDSIVSTIATGLYGAVEGVKVADGSLTDVLAQAAGIDFTTSNVATLLTDETYGQTYAAAASTIRSAGSWKKVNKDSLKWGVTDRQSFVNALVAVLRPIDGVLDALLNNGDLKLLNSLKISGSDGYTSFIVPLLEALGCYNIKTQYQYRQDMSNAYDNILIDILNPILDKVEDILSAPIQTLMSMLPNLALGFANNGLLQLIDNLLEPVSSLLVALKPVANVNDILDAAGLDIGALLKKIGITKSVKIDVYDLKATLEPLIGSDNVVSLVNGILGIIDIKGTKLGLELPDIDWYQLASHGKVITNAASQAATIGSRIYVEADQDQTLIALLRFLVTTINYKGNYQAIVDLVGGLIGGASDSISDVVGQVLGMLQGDPDEVISSLVELLQTLA